MFRPPDQQTHFQKRHVPVAVGMEQHVVKFRITVLGRAFV